MGRPSTALDRTPPPVDCVHKSLSTLQVISPRCVAPRLLQFLGKLRHKPGSLISKPGHEVEGAHLVAQRHLLAHGVRSLIWGIPETFLGFVGTFQTLQNPQA